MGTRFEGVRPKHAVCERCGYGIGGIAIRAGVIVCPECAHQNQFDRSPRGFRAPNHWLARITVLFLLGLLAVMVALAITN